MSAKKPNPSKLIHACLRSSWARKSDQLKFDSFEMELAWIWHILQLGLIIDLFLGTDEWCHHRGHGKKWVEDWIECGKENKRLKERSRKWILDVSTKILLDYGSLEGASQSKEEHWSTHKKQKRKKSSLEWLWSSPSMPKSRRAWFWLTFTLAFSNRLFHLDLLKLALGSACGNLPLGSSF